MTADMYGAFLEFSWSSCGYECVLNCSFYMS